MIPAGFVEKTIQEIAPHLEAGDILIDGGNSYYIDDIRRAKELAAEGNSICRCGNQRWGVGAGARVLHDDWRAGCRSAISGSYLQDDCSGIGDIARTPGREKVGGTAEQGYLHCGGNGGGHFVKMVHNGIEYGMMAAYAEGLGVLKAADIGKHRAEIDAETTPLARSGTLSV